MANRRFALGLSLLATLTELNAQRPANCTSPPAAFTIASLGCPEAHCEPTLSGIVRAMPPLTATTQIVARAETAGSGPGLGCSTNAVIAACLYNDAKAGPTLVAYTADGHQVFDSGSLLGPASSSVPLISSGGEVIAADSQTLVRFGPSGCIVWQTATSNGKIISSALTANGVVVTSGPQGPIAAYSIDTGALLGSITVVNGSSTYNTANSVSVNGNRLYVLMESTTNDEIGLLAAIDADPTNTASPLTIAWTLNFSGPSGTSPTFSNGRVYFNATGLTPGTPGPSSILAIQDAGSTYSVLWQKALPGTAVDPNLSINAALVQDPRGGLWYFIAGGSALYRVDGSTGETLQIINAGGPPTCAPTIALSSSNTPVMLLGLAAASNGTLPTYVEAIDLVQSTIIWRVQVGSDSADNIVIGQLPVATDLQGKARVIFPGNRAGTFFVGAP